MTYTFISGATGGIGKAFANECAKLGYNLFLTGRSEEKLKNLKGGPRMYKLIHFSQKKRQS